MTFNYVIFWYNKNREVISMKKLIIYDYFIPFLAVLICSAFLLYIPYSNASANKTNVITIADKIEKENENNKLIVKQSFKNIEYYLYENTNSLKSYFIDEDNNKLMDIYSIIKEDKVIEFNDKINYLLSLKYPKFIVDAINTNSTKNYEVRENEMVIYYSDVNLELEESLTLTVNYNEIKDFLDITFKLDKVYVNEDGFNYDPNKKSVALSFDDGPSGNKTLEIVDILKDNKAHATFFMVGNKMNYYSTVVTTVHNSSNEIGSHTYNHCNLSKTKIERILEQEQKTAQIYYDLTKDTLKLTRPPYGAINKKVKERLNTIFVTWNIDTEDWRYRDVEHIKTSVLDNIKDGDIILMHDSYDTTVEAVRQLLPILYSKGYQVVSVSELAKLKGVTLENNNIYRSFN